MGISNQIQWWQGWYNTKLTPSFCKLVQSELSKNCIWFPNIQVFLFVTYLCSLHAYGKLQSQLYRTGTRQVPCPRFFRKAVMLQRAGGFPSLPALRRWQRCPSLLGMPPDGGTQSGQETQNHHLRGSS